MKLQSQVTRKFDRAELQRLAKASRPARTFGLLSCACAGLTLGFLVVAILRALL